MAQAVGHRRARTQKKSEGGLLSLLMMIVLVFGGLFYGYKALTTGELLWFSSSFSAVPRQITIVERGERIVLDPGDPAFATLTEAFNTSISRGYQFSSSGISDLTWDRIEQNGVMVEAVYAGPVELRGGVTPSERLMILLGGKDIWTRQALFRSNRHDWDRNPLALNTTEPIRKALEQMGITVGVTQ